MKQDPCPICGGTDLNLIDGYYYCVECGTQDTNAQETVVEHTVLADGTFAHTATRKITKFLKDAIEMSGEWHKWHAFNFILAGLVEELMNLGASARFQNIVLWIWTRYMKEFMNKDQMGTISEIQEKEDNVAHKSLFVYEDEIEDNFDKPNDEEICNNKTHKAQRERAKKKLEEDRNSLKVITKGLLLSIIYLALNLDRSDIQLSHLFRFIREGRLSIANAKKFVPKEVDLISIPNWKNFMNCNKEYATTNVRQIAMTLIKVLDLGKLIVPDVRKMVNNFVMELCLPKDFKDLVFSLMHEVPCDFLELNDYKFSKNYIVRVPDYEGVIMSYVIVALKMTFGLDDHYEVTLLGAVDKINDEENRLKSYKLGLYSEPTDRLFSFREWSNYLMFRKTLLCKYYLPMAQQHNLDVDDHIFMEHLEERQKRKVLLSDEVTMDIINKIAPTDEGSVIPKSEFVATLTPLAEYTNVILHYIQDPEVKLLISEDFSQYSLKYACKELKLLNDGENLIIGVCEEKKNINNLIIGNLVSNESDFSMVFVKNCENQNWLKTNPPTADHITKIEENSNDKDSDLGYASNLESTHTDVLNVDRNDSDSELRELENIEEEKEGVSIFDDPFDNIDIKEETVVDLEEELNSFEFPNDRNYNNDAMEANLESNIHGETIMRETEFNPETFQRDLVIKELVLAACKKYKIPIPKEYDSREPREYKRRKKEEIDTETGPVAKKIKISRRGDAQKEIDKILTAYYESVEKDLVEKATEYLQLNDVLKNFTTDGFENGNDEVHMNSDNCEVGNRNQDDNVQTNEDSTVTEIDNFNKTVDSSVMEVDADAQTTVDDIVLKVDPKFDQRTHDVKQLYIKYSQHLQFENLIDDRDSVLDKILDNKIEECRLNDPIVICAKDLKQQNKKGDENVFDDEGNDQEEENMYLKERLMQKEEELGPLIENSEEVNQFKYWLRHYTSLCMRKNVDLKEKFDSELKENFPNSFRFVIIECAAILDCTPYSLYKHVQNLEQRLFK